MNVYHLEPPNPIFDSYRPHACKTLSSYGRPRQSSDAVVVTAQDFFRKHINGHKMDEQLACAIDLMRRLPPQHTEENLSHVIDVVPQLQEELLNAVDQPLKVHRCKKTGKDFIVSEFNRDGDSVRSPWSNEYDPPPTDKSPYPSSRLRKLEEIANEAFDTYRELYYEGGVSSAYFWEDGDGSFAGAVLFKKEGDGGRKTKGAWDSIHVFRASERGRNAQYKLTSTVMLYTITTKPELGYLNLSGNMTRETEAQYPLGNDMQAHIANVGRMIEDMELKMRNLLQEVYFGKTKDIVNGLRSINSLAESNRQAEIQREILGQLPDFSKMTPQHGTTFTSMPTNVVKQ